MKIMIGTVSAVLLWMAAPAAGLAPCPQDIQRSKTAAMPIYSVSEIVDHHIPTSNFSAGKTKVHFEGTSNMPTATGDARVEDKTGYLGISANFSNLQPACTFGSDFLTYVLWAITPEGRATNLGEVVLLTGKNEDKARLDVTTEFQAFGMMVTAEPHFAVSRPSNLVVLQNIAIPEPVVCDPCAGIVSRNGTTGIQPYDSEKSDAARVGDDVADKTEDALRQGGNIIKKGLDAVPGVHIDSNSNSSRTYTDADSTPTIDWGGRSSVAQARNAVRLANAADAATYAPEILAKATRQLFEAEHNTGSFTRTDALAREAAQTAEDARIMSVRGAMIAAALRMRDQEEARLKAETNVAKAEGVIIVGESAALADAERALMKSEEEKAALRAKLAQQLNMIMTTRETVRGLIVDMADVRFATARYELKPEDKEKLAKVAGILLSYPGLTLEVEGYTDNTGTEKFNQTLSEQRAQAVRDYLISQGIPASRITAKGFGETMPTASNDTPEGRQKNRRVEVVVSGESIGITIDGTVQ